MFISGDTFHSSGSSLASCGQLEKTDKHDELAGLWPAPNAAGVGSGVEAGSHSTGYGAGLLHCHCAPAPVLLHMVSTVQSRGSPRQRMREHWCGFKPTGHCISRPSALLAHGRGTCSARGPQAVLVQGHRVVPPLPLPTVQFTLHGPWEITSYSHHKLV